MLDALRQADFVERATHQRADALEAAMEHGPGTSGDSHISRLEHFKRDERGMRQIPQFMRQEPEALGPACGLSVDVGQRSFAPVLGDRARDGVVQVAIEQPKVLRADGRARFDGQLRDGLTDVAIVVDDLRHGEPLTQQVVPVQYRTPADLRV
jgi:hypothetical protein